MNPKSRRQNLPGITHPPSTLPGKPAKIMLGSGAMSKRNRSTNTTYGIDG
jgi:hypothetical protein